MNLSNLVFIILVKNVFSIQNIHAIQTMMDNFEHKLDTNLLFRGHVKERKYANRYCQMHNGPSCELVNAEKGYQQNNELMKNPKYRSLYHMIDSLSKATYNKVQEQLQQNAYQNDFYVQKDRQRMVLDQMRNNPSKIQQIAKENNIHDYVEIIDLKVFDGQKYVYVRDDQYTYFSNNVYSDYLLKIEIEQHQVGSKNIKLVRFSKPVYVQEMKFRSEDYSDYKVVGTYKEKQVFYNGNKLKFGSEIKNMVISDVSDIKLDQIYLSDKLKLSQIKIGWDHQDDNDDDYVVTRNSQQQKIDDYQKGIKISQEKLKELQKTSDRMVNKLLNQMGYDQKQIEEFKEKLEKKIQKIQKMSVVDRNKNSDKDSQQFREELANQLLNGDYELLDLNLDDLGLDYQDIDEIDESLFDNL